ncbi:hypothetical protein O6H91_16G048700 [Diphasiastrum complanatum]|uniref:Uncharacterized protein n=2 Tax=Diphasiastrum complanatum TaxID=34168 RepID=A0ACC2BC54_DIPCM|nr:hypothetical protein O6H91_16G048700 [Diphasiastrum complanatum]KAJ7527332.1 hypothetical protein O6H91_16G048700 [Diphasiastrum complanatum]
MTSSIFACRNGNGYEMAKKYRAKFTHISPVWYQLKRGHKDLELIGGHDVDTDWIKDVRQEGQPLIVPRVVLEGWPLDNMLVETREKLQAIQLISSECRKRGYDGIVFEAWSLWSAYGTLQNSKLRQKALNFVQELGSSLHNIVLPRQTRNMQLIFVIPPVSRQAQELRDFTAADMAYLKDAVDAYSLMTYDFSNSYNPGPTAPLSWMRTCIQSVISLIGGNDNPIADNVLKLGPVSNQARHQGSLGRKMDNNMSKILVGINFYGNDFVLPQGGGPILGHEYLSLLSSYKPKLSWDGFNDEHYFDYTVAQELHRVFYPSLKSLSLRLEEAKSCGAGVSIWEIGQGLEYFFDLL